MDLPKQSTRKMLIVIMDIAELQKLMARHAIIALNKVLIIAGHMGGENLKFRYLIIALLISINSIAQTAQEYYVSANNISLGIVVKNNEVVKSDNITNYVNNQYEAIYLYTKAIELDSAMEVAYWGRGMCKSHLENDQDAIVDYTKAIYINPLFREAYYMRGISYSKLHKMNMACIDYNTAFSLGDKNVIKEIREQCK